MPIYVFARAMPFVREEEEEEEDSRLRRLRWIPKRGRLELLTRTAMMGGRLMNVDAGTDISKDVRI